MGSRVWLPGKNRCLRVKLSLTDTVKLPLQLSGELGLQYLVAKSGARIDGIYRHRSDLASGRFALIET
jgi:hypothetical protein